MPERRTAVPQTREEVDRQVGFYNKSGKRGKTVASCDLSGLKWVNDKFGHETGDLLLQLVGAAFQSQGIDAYHIHGDEFAALFASPQEAEKQMIAVQQVLAETPIATDLNGVQDTWMGWRLDYGTGETYKDADEALLAKRADEEAKGARSPRGSQPRTVTSRLAERDKDQRAINAVKEAARHEQAVAAEQRRKLVPWENENRQPTARELYNWFLASGCRVSDGSRSLFGEKEIKSNLRIGRLFRENGKPIGLDEAASVLQSEDGVVLPHDIQLDDSL